jgi:type II restriction enzyme
MGEGLDRYRSGSQRARVVTEAWGAENLYCPACDSPRIESLAANTPAHDYRCPSCSSWFQLKSKSSGFRSRVSDGAFETMKRAILEDRTPNLFLLHYRLPAFVVASVLLIPRFVFTVSILEKRKPLSPTARRAGWVGCNFLLHGIPSGARISVIEDGKKIARSKVRAAYDKLRPLESLKLEKRGWTLDVLNVVQELGKKEFALRDVYAKEEALQRLHPDNHNVQAKIRQQMQELREMGMVEFLGGGEYRVR